MPDFFDSVDALGIAELHTKRIVKLEESQALRLIAKYREVRRDLQDRLNAARVDSFTAQQLRGTLLQVELAIEAMNQGLRSEMVSAGNLTADAGVTDLVEELQSFEEHFTGAVVPINVNAALIANEANDFLINKYQASLDAYSEALRAQITGSLTSAIIGEMPYAETVQNIGKFFLGEEWKIHRIARTELHHTYAMGKLMTMKQLVGDQVPDLMKTLYHPMDSRTAADSKYVDRLNLIVPVSQPFRYKWKGELREYMTPPDRPNDRSILIPYRPTWG